ncbi:hypothetical protein Tco_0752893 [Tanacetum coccineum]
MCNTTTLLTLIADYTSDSNIILYDQYMEDNEEHGSPKYVRNTQVKVFIDHIEFKLQDIRNWLRGNGELDELEGRVKSEHEEYVGMRVGASRETLEIAELTRKRMYEKMKSPQCIQNKVKFAPPDYSKENYLAIFAPQRDLTPEQIFWAKDENDRKKVEASVLKPLSTPTVYPPNTPVKLVPRITRAHTSEKTSTMLNEIESLKAQLKSKVSCVTSDSVKPKVLAPDMYVIDVKLIPHPLKNNRSAHLNYINHLKESVETVRRL